MFAAGAIVRLAPASPQEVMHGITEGEHAEEIALFLCSQAHHQGGRNKSLQARVAAVEIAGVIAHRNPRFTTAERALSREASMIDIDLLGPLDLEDLGDGMTALGSGLPVDFIETVAGDIFAQFLELSSLAVLAPSMNAVAAPVEEERGQAVSFRGQVGINPDLARDLPDSPEGPEAQERFRFEITPVDMKLTALQGGTGPRTRDVFSVLRAGTARRSS